MKNKADSDNNEYNFKKVVKNLYSIKYDMKYGNLNTRKKRKETINLLNNIIKNLEKYFMINQNMKAQLSKVMGIEELKYLIKEVKNEDK